MLQAIITLQRTWPMFHCYAHVFLDQLDIFWCHNGCYSWHFWRVMSLIGFERLNPLKYPLQLGVLDRISRRHAGDSDSTLGIVILAWIVVTVEVTHSSPMESVNASIGLHWAFVVKNDPSTFEHVRRSASYVCAILECMHLCETKQSEPDNKMLPCYV